VAPRFGGSGSVAPRFGANFGLPPVGPIPPIGPIRSFNGFRPTFSPFGRGFDRRFDRGFGSGFPGLYAIGALPDYNAEGYEGYQSPTIVIPSFEPCTPTIPEPPPARPELHEYKRRPSRSCCTMARLDQPWQSGFRTKSFTTSDPTISPVPCHSARSIVKPHCERTQRSTFPCNCPGRTIPELSASLVCGNVSRCRDSRKRCTRNHVAGDFHELQSGLTASPSAARERCGHNSGCFQGLYPFARTRTVYIMRMQNRFEISWPTVAGGRSRSREG
jgi:hypothetical protein